MRQLSDRLTRELVENGNLPISAEGMVRLRPDIAGEMGAARKLLEDEIELHPQDVEVRASRDREDLLEARFVPASETAEQHHLFMIETSSSESDVDRIKRWSKMPVSYGSLVQVKRFLTDAWGDILELELQRSEVGLCVRD